MGGFSKRFPNQKHSLRSQLLIDVSNARAHAVLGDWTKVSALVSPWINKPLDANQELPVRMKGELFLLAGEAGRKIGSASAEKWLIEAKAVFERNDVAESKRLMRAKRALGEIDQRSDS